MEKKKKKTMLNLGKMLKKHVKVITTQILAVQLVKEENKIKTMLRNVINVLIPVEISMLIFHNMHNHALMLQYLQNVNTKKVMKLSTNVLEMLIDLSEHDISVKFFEIFN